MPDNNSAGQVQLSKLIFTHNWEDPAMDEKALKEKLSFIYIVIAIIYNPILPLFYVPNYWVAMHMITILFFWYKTWHFKRQIP